MTPPRPGTEEERESDVQPDPKRPVALSREQQRLHDALSERGESLGAMYLGGLQVLHDAANPDRTAQSAHSMRELMEKIVDPKRRPGLKAKVNEVEDRFRAQKSRTDCHSDSAGWAGPIDPPLRKILQKLEDFLDWFAAFYPRKKERFRYALRRMEGTHFDVAEASFKVHWRTWKGLDRYFQGVSHHGKSTSTEEIRRRIAALEDFLASRLLPTTFDELDAIDTLLKESGNA
jgi:hypothetical protein